mmetsp:Transcript_3853/g.5733  ORF Transcript_3853/g.5733 Transcript_3853/m.5733 type:complete len:172 (-) Transcript_3853:890-1405(-)
MPCPLVFDTAYVIAGVTVFAIITIADILERLLFQKQPVGSEQPVGSKDTRTLSVNEPQAYPFRKPQPLNSNSAKAAATNANDHFTKLIFSDMFVDSAVITTKWSDVVGLKRAKQALQEAAILPSLRPDLFTNLRSNFFLPVAPRHSLVNGMGKVKRFFELCFKWQVPTHHP